MNVRVLDGWLPRGFLQLFEAVLTLELSGSTAQGETDLHKSLRLYRLLAGISLVVCSGLYILGGVLCCGRNRAKGAEMSSCLCTPSIRLPLRGPMIVGISGC